jgi:hypothetical protein
VGTRVDGVEHHIRTPQRNQIPSTRELHGRVDRDANSPASIEHETWTMYFDGSVMKEGVGVGLVFISPLACAWSTWCDYISRHQTTPPSTKP